MEILERDKLWQYEEFVKGHPKGHFTQSIQWADVKKMWNFEAVVSKNEKNEIVGAIGVLIRKIPALKYTVMYAPRGPVCDPHDRAVIEDLTAGIKELAKRYKAYVFRADPDIESEDGVFTEIVKGLGYSIKEDSKTFDAIQPRYVFRLNVEGKTREEIMAGFHSKTRYNIRVAQKNNVQIRLGTREDLKDFYRIMIETGMRDNFVTRSLEYFETMYDALGENLRLYMADYEGSPVAGTIAIHYGDKVWYLYGASSNTSRNVMPNYLLQWSMIEWAIDSGARIYDFRGVAGILDEGHPLYGLYRFKKGFGGQFTEFVGELSLVLNKPVNTLVNMGERVYRKYIKLRYKLKNRGKK